MDLAVGAMSAAAVPVSLCSVPRLIEGECRFRGLPPRRRACWCACTCRRRTRTFTSQTNAKRSSRPSLLCVMTGGVRVLDLRSRPCLGADRAPLTIVKVEACHNLRRHRSRAADKQSSASPRRYSAFCERYKNAAAAACPSGTCGLYLREMRRLPVLPCNQV